MLHLDGSAVDLIIAERWRPETRIGMSAVAYGETVRAAYLHPDIGNLIRKAGFVRDLPFSVIFPFDRTVAEIFAELSPRRTGGQQARDLMIAATAIARNAPLATNDRRLAALHGASVSGRDPLEILHIE